MTVSDHDTRSAASLILDLERNRGVLCAGCERPLGSHEVLAAIAIGFKNAPRCLGCLGEALQCDPARLGESLLAFIHQRACYAEAWNWANREKGLPDGFMPPSLLGAGAGAPDADPLKAISCIPSTEGAIASWDAGEQGCGELVLELRLRLEKLEAGQVFKLTARDAGAPEDLPAWCRLTGHTLLRGAHPHYWIQRKS